MYNMSVKYFNDFSVLTNEKIISYNYKTSYNL